MQWSRSSSRTFAWRVQRVEPGTVFGYLPVKVGETFTDDKGAESIRALYNTGFFKDVQIRAEGNVLVVRVEERPAISQLEFIGIKEFDKDTLRRCCAAWAWPRRATTTNP